LRLPRDAKLRLAIRARWAAVLIAILASSFCSLFGPDSTAAFGMPQSGHAGNKCGIPAARDADQQISFSSSGSAERVSHSPQTVIPARENLQLTVKAGCANVDIFTDTASEVTYSVRLDPKIAGADAGALLRDFALTAHNTSRGIVLIGHAWRESDCRVNVTYEIHAPRRYDLDIEVQSGDIGTQDVGGVVVLSTGGGNIRAGRVETSDAARKALAGAAFTARLETAGGDISIGDVAGGLRAATAGGRISAGDVHGPAVLRTGGGDIHVGHVFGAARFTSGGGNITADKVDGGVWADTAGGRVEIGGAAEMAPPAPQFPAGERDASPAAVLGRRSGSLQPMPATSDLAEIIGFARLFDVFLWGGIRVDPADQQKRLVISVAPEYPDVARLAGIEGDVTLRILVGEDGTIAGITPVSGPPVLARAAMRAVEQWRYVPALVDGHPADVVTTVTLAFRLHP
jgi:TonB family protein